MTNIVVSSGNTFTLFDLGSGDTMWVLSGATADRTTVSSGGREIVSSGGASLGGAILSGGLEVLFSGATGSSVTVLAGGRLSGGGLLSGANVDLGLVSGVSIVSAAGPGFGSLTVGNHGIASGVTVNDSFAYIASGGIARNLNATGGALVVVSAGGTTTGTDATAGGGSEEVFGVTHGTVIGTGASELISSGGLAVGTIVSSGADQIVSNGGLASAAVLHSGGTQFVESGGEAKGTIVASSGSEGVLNGGVTLNSIIVGGGIEIVSSGGVASGFTVSTGGDLTVFSGGVARLPSLGSSTNFGLIDVKSTAELDLAGTLENGGSVVLENSNIVNITTAKATLTGSGLIDMASNVLITGLSASDVLDNEGNTIEGTGQIGGENLTVINRGVIDANQTGNELTLNATLLTNTGLMEATNSGGGLTLFGPIKNSGGVIEANGGDIFLQPTTTISGGVLSGTGTAEFFAENSVTLDGSGQALTNKAVILDVDGAALTLDGAIQNAGVISLGGVGDHTDLDIDGASVTLTGSGIVLLSENTSNRIFGDATTFTNVLDNVDNTIEGAGDIGAGKLVLVNSGTIAATSDSVSLLIDPTSATNVGLMESTGAGGLVIVSATINNSGGVIAGNQGDVYLEAGAQILGGVLSSTPLSHIFVANDATSAVTLNGVASPVTNNGNMFVADSSELDLVGAIVNAGQISLNAGADFTDLVVNGTSATLTGGGVVELSDSADNRILGEASADKLINVDNTIEGSGELGASQLTLVNSGTIDATGASASLTVDATVTINTGLIEDTGPGGLLIDGVVRNAGGVVEANGNSVILEGNTVISGGLLTATDQGEFFVTGAGAKLVGTAASHLTNAASVIVEDAAQLNLAGAIVNNGVIGMDGSSNLTTLMAATNVTLTGSGVIELANNAANRIMGAASTTVFDNESNTIEGEGEIGGGQLTLINRGTIDATGSLELKIDATSVTNAGLIENTGDGLLLIRGVVHNSGGLIAANPGSILLSHATISGGVLSSTNGGIIFDDGVVTLDGTASLLTNKAHVFVDDGVQLFLAGAIANTGSILLDSVADNTDLVVGAASATLTGAGTIELTDNADNRIFGVTGADVLNNKTNIIEGAGQIGVGQLTLFNGGTINANGATNSLVIDTTAATNSGLIEASTAPGLIIESVIQNASGVIGAFGGDVSIHSGGVVSGGVFSGQGGGANLIEVLSGGAVVGASVGAGADEVVSSGAIQRGVTVLAGGVEEVSAGARVSGSVILNGGFEIASTGASTFGATVSAGGSLLGPGALFKVINDRGVISGALVRSGGSVNVFSGGMAQNVRIASSGLMTLSGGGAASAVVSSGANLNISSGGVSTEARVLKGGSETISTGGMALAALLSGGTELDFGTASGTIVRSGGSQVVENHGLASGSLVSNGGQEVVSFGGAALATQVFAGGTLVVAVGGALSGGLTIHAGLATIDGAMGAGQTVNFAGTQGVLKLDNLPAFKAKISGLATTAEKIDLGGFAFGSGETVTWTQSGTSGTLTVHDGAKTASLTLIGTYTASSFNLHADGHGGTFVFDPPPAKSPTAAAAATRFAQALAGLDGSRSGGLAAVHAGGSAVSSASALVTAAMSGR